MLQLPAFWSHLGELQAAFSLPVVRGWTPPWGEPRRTEPAAIATCKKGNRLTR
jgi:hypothetical protein